MLDDPEAGDGTLDFPDFRPRAPWWGGDLQTVRNVFITAGEDLTSYAAQRLELPLDDGTGDRLSAVLHRPEESGRGRPLVILVPGLTGDEESLYIVRSAAHLLRAGYLVLRLNLRGAGRSRPLCRFQYHAGRSEDLRAALAALPAPVQADGVVLVGYSLGANMLLKLLGEGAPDAVVAACAISAPIDLAAAARRIQSRRNFAYQRHILGRMKRESLLPPAELSDDERRAIRRARSVVEFDAKVTAPRNGFAGPEDYYRRCSSISFLDAIAVPTLIIHALDDPWIPGASYLAVDWSRNAKLTPLLSRRGGHVGFAGTDRSMRWHDQCLLRFLARSTATGTPEPRRREPRPPASLAREELTAKG